MCHFILSAICVHFSSRSDRVAYASNFVFDTYALISPPQKTDGLRGTSYILSIYFFCNDFDLSIKLFDNIFVAESVCRAVMTNF